MLNLIITFSLLAFNCHAFNPEINQCRTEVSICNDSWGVVLRSTQKLYCSEANFLFQR